MDNQLPKAMEFYIHGDYGSAINLGLFALAESGLVEAQEMAGTCYPQRL